MPLVLSGQAAKGGSFWVTRGVVTWKLQSLWVEKNKFMAAPPDPRSYNSEAGFFFCSLSANICSLIL